MTTTQRLFSATLLSGLLPFVVACATSEPFVRGTVVSANAAGVAIRHRSGQVVYASVSPATTYRWDHRTASAADVVVGARVMVILQRERGPLGAVEIRIYSLPKGLP